MRNEKLVFMVYDLYTACSEGRYKNANELLEKIKKILDTYKDAC
jgi:hypothetical protein